MKVDLIYSDTGTTKPPGGQQAGSPHSNVRVTHIPSGVMAQCGYDRSLHKNRQIAEAMIALALKMLLVTP